MSNTRQDLISICDNFLNGIIFEKDIEEYALKVITSNDFEFQDEIIADIIYEWEDHELNYPINKINMGLWKKRLETGIDLLPEYNIWNYHIDKQKEICVKYNSKWNPINKKYTIGISKNIESDPLHALRHKTKIGSICWYIWTGDYSTANDFFSPLCAEHLLQIRPQIIKYLGLDSGFRFLIDRQGYEDVWFDENLAEESV